MCCISTKSFSTVSICNSKKSIHYALSLSMLCVLRIFKPFLESHNRPLYSDISFTHSCGQLDCSDYIVQSCKNNSCIRDEIYTINYSYTYKTSISINIGSALFLFNMPRKNVSLRYCADRLRHQDRVQLKIQDFWEFSKCYIELCIPGLILSINSLQESPENTI